MQVLKKIFSLLLRIAISIILLAFLFQKVDKESLLRIIREADKVLLFFAFLITSLNYIICLLRWEMLLKATQINLPLRRVITSFSAGIFFNLFLPSTIGGDLVRSADLALHTQKPREVVATVLLDRLSGYVGLVTLASVSLLVGWRLIEDRSVLLSLGIITAILIMILLVLFNTFIYSRVNKFLHIPKAKRISEAIKNLHQELYRFRGHKEIILKNLFLSVAIQTVTPLSFYIIALALGLKVKLLYFFIFIPIIAAITLLPISIGGLGLRDVSTIFFFAQAGIAKDLAFAMALLSFLFIFIYGILGGLVYVFTVHHRRL